MKTNRGFTMIEVLVTIVILAIGLLGMAGLQLKTQSVEMESYQRTQAQVILADMTNRLQVAMSNPNVIKDPDKIAAYLVDPADPVGGTVQDCTGLLEAERDLCEWNNALSGAGETSAGGDAIGAMIGARGCITEIQAPNVTAGSCQVGIYEVTVTWQGLEETVAPANTCAKGLYGREGLRRAISARVGAGTGECI